MNSQAFQHWQKLLQRKKKYFSAFSCVNSGRILTSLKNRPEFSDLEFVLFHRLTLICLCEVSLLCLSAILIVWLPGKLITLNVVVGICCKWDSKGARTFTICLSCLSNPCEQHLAGRRWTVFYFFNSTGEGHETFTMPFMWTGCMLGGLKMYIIIIIDKVVWIKYYLLQTVALCLHVCPDTFSSQFILESKWMLVPEIKKSPSRYRHEVTASVTSKIYSVHLKIQLLWGIFVLSTTASCEHYNMTCRYKRNFKGPIIRWFMISFVLA